MRYHNKTIHKRKNMEIKSSDMGNILSNKGNPSDNSDIHELSMDKREVGSWFNVLCNGYFDRSFNISRFQEVFNKQRMAEIKASWILFNMIGIPVYILGIVNNLDNYKSAILFLMGLLYSCTIIFRSYQKGRKERIANDREQFHLELEKKQINQKHTTP